MMSRLQVGFLAGITFGLLDILPMFFMEFPNPYIAMAGAFASRFAIGFLIPNTTLPFPEWLSGLLIGLLISIPDAIITGAFGPILGTGIIGGAVIGFLVNRKTH